MSGTLEYVVGLDGLYTADGRIEHVRSRSLADALEEIVAPSGTMRIVAWLHESAHEEWYPGMETADAIAASLGVSADAISGDGWLRLSPTMHVAFPRLTGVFAGTASPAQLALVLATWRTLIGSSFLYSAPSCAMFLVDDRKLEMPHAPPREVFEEWNGSAYSVPAHVWTRLLTVDEAERAGVQLFDRRGSYLAAWRGIELPDGPWSDAGLRTAGVGDLHHAGYYLIDTGPLEAFVAELRLPDPFARIPRDDETTDGPRWLTAPLATLAGELSKEAGVTLRYVAAFEPARAVRALDRAGERLANARHSLEGDDSLIARLVLEQVKDAYTRATAHFEYGKRPGHMFYRPSWRHHIVDRHVANTWRSLRKCGRRPIAVGGVDSALFACDDPTELIDAGLPSGLGLGTWKRRGEHLPMVDALRAWSDWPTGARDFVRDAISGDS